MKSWELFHVFLSGKPKFSEFSASTNAPSFGESLEVSTKGCRHGRYCFFFLTFIRSPVGADAVPVTKRLSVERERNTSDCFSAFCTLSHVSPFVRVSAIRLKTYQRVRHTFLCRKVFQPSGMPRPQVRVHIVHIAYHPPRPPHRHEKGTKFILPNGESAEDEFLKSYLCGGGNCTHYAYLRCLP